MVSAVPITLVLALLVRWSVQLCAPDCTGIENGIYVRDPTDCTRYYVCVNVGSGVIIPSEEPVSCPAGYYFNDEHMVPRCDPIANAPIDYCTNLCNPCVYMCDAPGQLTPNPLHCYSYYVCLETDVLELECASSTPYFDFMTGVCTADNSVCFDYCDICVPHCTENNERVPDPYNCHNFYECNPPNLALVSCPHNEVFNRETGICDATAPCIVDC